jgi:hypothetical protein
MVSGNAFPAMTQNSSVLVPHSSAKVRIISRNAVPIGKTCDFSFTISPDYSSGLIILRRL